MARARLLALAAAALLLAGCSATKLAYNNLDSLVAWQVGKFVKLSGPSEELFDAGFRSLWRWHRRTQLPLYAADLRELGQAAQAPMSVAQIEAYRSRAQAHVDNALAQGLADGVRVLVALDDGQVDELIRQMGKRRAERIEEGLEQTPAEARDEARERLLKSLKRWVGSLNAEQKARVATWSEGLMVDARAQAAASQAWGEAWNALLRDRAAPDFQERLVGLLEYRDTPGREAVRTMYEHNERSAVMLLSELTASFTPSQREHLRRELEDLALDLEQLTAVSSE